MAHNVRVKTRRTGDISAERQVLYYSGMILSAFGGLLLVVSMLNAFSPPRAPVPVPLEVRLIEQAVSERDSGQGVIPGSFSSGGGDGWVQENAPDPFDDALGSIRMMLLGGGLVGLGAFIMRVGRFGWAGSGVVLDPAQAREDFKPFSAAAGGVLSDVMESAGIDTEAAGFCTECGQAFETGDKFCSRCGHALG